MGTSTGASSSEEGMGVGPDERAELQRRERSARRRGMALVAFFLLVAVLGLLSVVLLRSDGEPGRGCTADARLGPNGQTYGRDPERKCHFIDENGNDLGG